MARQASPGAVVPALTPVLAVHGSGNLFVLDERHRLRYRGAVDDQYGLGYTREVPTVHFLRNALDALRSGQPVSQPATSAPGCYIDADPEHDQYTPRVPGGHPLS